MGSTIFQNTDLAKRYHQSAILDTRRSIYERKKNHMRPIRSKVVQILLGRYDSERAVGKIFNQSTDIPSGNIRWWKTSLRTSRIRRLSGTLSRRMYTERYPWYNLKHSVGSVVNHTLWWPPNRAANPTTYLSNRTGWRRECRSHRPRIADWENDQSGKSLPPKLIEAFLFVEPR